MGDRHQSSIFSSFFVVICLLLTVTANAQQTAPDRGSVPSGLPPHVFVGISSSPADLTWMRSSGIPWGARYQYLAGGVNTGSGWATWGTSFVSDYVQASQGAGMLPVFTYYQLLQSSPSLGNNEGEKVWSNLQNPATMKAYYEDFKKMLQQIAQTGKAAIVHVEPDLWGYLQARTNGTDDPLQLSVSVSSSGHPDVALFANNAADFGKALLRLRDLYAPRAILATHASMWATSQDVGTSTNATLNVTAIGQRTAKFLSATGNWDLVFCDVSDRDAEFYRLIYGDGGAHWWDKTNQRLPNFDRFQLWADALTVTMRKRLVVWQIPVGNTFSRSLSNTWGHYQDNRAEYYLENYPTNTKLAALSQAGVIGLLFGAGADGNTTPYDTLGDGITNPMAINGNNEIAQFADDDGGYLRTRVGRYYSAGPVALDVTQPPTPAPSPSPITPAPSPSPSPVVVPPAPVLAPPVLFDNALRNSWMDWSWATHTLQRTSPVYTPTASVGATFGPWTGLYFAHNGFDTSGYRTIRFYIHGGTRSGQRLNASVRYPNGSAGPNVSVGPNCAGGQIAASRWVQCNLSLSALGAANQKITGIILQEGAGVSLPTLSVDELRFVQ